MAALLTSGSERLHFNGIIQLQTVTAKKKELYSSFIYFFKKRTEYSFFFSIIIQWRQRYNWKKKKKKKHKSQYEAKTNFGIIGSQWDRPFAQASAQTLTLRTQDFIQQTLWFFVTDRVGSSFTKSKKVQTLKEQFSKTQN